jgi:ferredoxin
MAHHTLKNGYSRLAERINLMPQGAPPGELLYKILSVLFSEKEADRVALLPLRPFTAQAAAAIWKTDIAEARTCLENLASRGMMLDMENPEGAQIFAMPPPMAGFFEFSMMRVGGSCDQKILAELYYRYLNVEEDFIKNLFAGGETQLGRVFVSEPALSEDNCLHVLDYERASEVIRTAAHRGIGTCYCRHKMSHLGRACGAPLEICMTFNGVAQSLVKHGIARSVDEREGLDLLDEAISHNLVQFGENVRESVSSICLGCGVCARACPAKAISLQPRGKRVITPVNSAHRTVLMAIERGKLQNLVFDHHAMESHRAMAAVLGVILKLPPAKQILAGRQMKSRYLDYLFSHVRV